MTEAHQQEISQLLTAIRFASTAHDGQLDKGGEPYIFHCLRVGGSLLPDVEAAVVGVLHDALEDTEFNPCEAYFHLRLSRDQIKALGLLCRLPFLSIPFIELPPHRPPKYMTYIRRLSQNPLARKVKIADLKDNLDPRRNALARERLREAGRSNEMRSHVARYRAALALLEALPSKPSKTQ